MKYQKHSLQKNADMIALNFAYKKKKNTKISQLNVISI